MKKYYSMIALAIASAMTLSSCHKESTEIIDPTGGEHEVEATIHAEVTGAFTKALSIEVEYKDFKGDMHTEIVNGNFDGKNAEFNTTIKTKADGNEKEATVTFKTNFNNSDSYKSEVSPWGMVCSVKAKLDSRDYPEFVYSKSETVPGKSLVEVHETWTSNWAYSAKNEADTYFNKGEKKYVIKVGKSGTVVDFR